MILDTAKEENGVLYYGISQRCNLVSREGDEPGTHLELVTGIGWNSKLAFTPLIKTSWIVIGMKLGFEVYEGRDLGSIRIDLKNLISKKDELYQIACGLLSFAHYKDLKPYGVIHCKRDFDQKLSEVSKSNYKDLQTDY